MLKLVTLFKQLLLARNLRPDQDFVRLADVLFLPCFYCLVMRFEDSLSTVYCMQPIMRTCDWSD